MEDITFAEDCISFGWEMDCGKSFFKKYNCSSFNEALSYINNENSIDLLGSLLFSHWRYFNHWSNSSSEILEYKNWFIILLRQIKTIIDNIAGFENEKITNHGL